MFENMSYESLQVYWWVIIAFLGGLLVFLLMVQGGQTLFGRLSRNEDEKTLIINLIGYKWEFTFTTLVVFGGSFFASFPLFYSTSFGGAYWVWMIILFAFIVQAVSYEYRKKRNNFLGSKTYETFLCINGIIAPILLGIAVSTFFTGSPFSINKTRILHLGQPTEAIISQWDTPWHGLDALWNGFHAAWFQNLMLGLAVFFLARTNALLYLQKMVAVPDMQVRIRKALKTNAVLFLVFFLIWFVRLLFIPGFAVDAQGKVFLEDYKYLHNLLQSPVTLIFILAGVLVLLYGLYLGVIKNRGKAFWFSAAGTVLAVMGLFFLAGLNHTAYYPSITDLQSSLTIFNSSSSRFTLVVMSYVSLMMPFVLAYLYWAWKTLDKGKYTLEKIQKEQVKY